MDAVNVSCSRASTSSKRAIGSENVNVNTETVQNELSSLLGSHDQQRTLPFVDYGGTSHTYNIIQDISTEHGHVISSSYDHDEIVSVSDGKFLESEDRLKRRLKYFFMNPLEKWKVKRKFPWKLVLQLVKIIFVTSQLCVFGTDGYNYEVQKQHTGSSFRHIFLRDWTSIREVVSYPPSTGPYAVYTKPEFYKNVDHVIEMFSKITRVALGTYGYDNENGTMTGMSFCQTRFVKALDLNSTLVFDGRTEEFCTDLDLPSIYPEGDPRWRNFSFRHYLEKQNLSISFERLIQGRLMFNIRTIFLKTMASYHYPDCYRFRITVSYDNSEHDGQIVIVLMSTSEKLLCVNSDESSFGRSFSYIVRQVLNCFVVIICILSLVLCARCLLKGRTLQKQTELLFKKQHQKPLSAHEKMEFIDMWYCMMVVNDILIIAGSILKACIEQRTVESDQYTTCAILLGSGNLLVWAGVLRYLGFFHKYNILILTLKQALPNVLRFMLCCVLLYCGFCFCGWIVLGPYHLKFRSLSSTSECLFAMMNGDDLFATFAITDTNSTLIWWFSRIYLYLFISMFIYVVISLFISVIMDSYETVKDYYLNGSPMTRIQMFIADCPEDSCSEFFRQQRRLRQPFYTRILRFITRRRDEP